MPVTRLRLHDGRMISAETLRGLLPLTRSRRRTQRRPSQARRGRKLRLRQSSGRIMGLGLGNARCGRVMVASCPAWRWVEKYGATGGQRGSATRGVGQRTGARMSIKMVSSMMAVYQNIR